MSRKADAAERMDDVGPKLVKAASVSMPLRHDGGVVAVANDARYESARTTLLGGVSLHCDRVDPLGIPGHIGACVGPWLGSHAPFRRAFVSGGDPASG